MVFKDLQRRCCASSPYPKGTQKRLRSAASNRSSGQKARLSRFSLQLIAVCCAISIKLMGPDPSLVQSVIVRDMFAIPVPIPPWKPPASGFRQIIGNRIVSGRAPWVASQNSRKPDPSTSPEPVSTDRLFRIVGTCRRVSASPAHEQRKRMPVNPDQTNCCPSGERQALARDRFGIRFYRRAHKVPMSLRSAAFRPLRRFLSL
ncbi:hypothetical protein LP7551_00256 [Roseibium album]|nr:hypothetical protein LP7551_00256 [Roseibium album]